MTFVIALKDRYHGYKYWSGSSGEWVPDFTRATHYACNPSASRTASRISLPTYQHDNLVIIQVITIPSRNPER